MLTRWECSGYCLMQVLCVTICIDFFLFHIRTQHKSAGEHHWLRAWLYCWCNAICRLGEEFEFGQGASNSSPTLHKGHSGFFNIHQWMPVDRTPGLTSIQGMAHTLMNYPACETPGWEFIAGSGFEPKLHSLEASVHTSKPSCQPFA